LKSESVFDNNPVIRFYSKIFPFSRNIYVVGVVSLELMYGLWIFLASTFIGVYPRLIPVTFFRDQLILVFLVPMYARFALRLDELKSYISQNISEKSNVMRIYNLIYSKKGNLISGLILAVPYAVFLVSLAMKFIRESKALGLIVYKSVTIFALLNIGPAMYQTFLGLFLIYRIYKFVEVDAFESDRDLIPFVELLLNGFIFIFILDFLTIIPSIMSGFKHTNLLWFSFFHSMLEFIALIYIVLQVYLLVKKAGFRVSRLSVLSLIFSSFRTFPSGAVFIFVLPLSLLLLLMIF